ncbi:ImmA/IrrE family metallo-endopeptidase [Streptococcus mutans]|nr:ImmA/IrrE family metallo-endopeptidase [Streptococcus mutans]
MELSKIVKDLENLGVTIIFCPLEDTKGQQLGTLDDSFILIDESLSDTEKINVILHEISHYINKDTENILSQSNTFAHYIEKEAEVERIINFMNLINDEYPIDESFNYLDYMHKALIPEKYENIVKETAFELYHQNQKGTNK